jgi:hypothetical protein
MISKKIKNRSQQRLRLNLLAILALVVVLQQTSCFEVFFYQNNDKKQGETYIIQDNRIREGFRVPQRSEDRPYNVRDNYVGTVPTPAKDETNPKQVLFFLAESASFVRIQISKGLKSNKLETGDYVDAFVPRIFSEGIHYFKLNFDIFEDKEDTWGDVEQGQLKHSQPVIIIEAPSVQVKTDTNEVP